MQHREEITERLSDLVTLTQSCIFFPSPACLPCSALPLHHGTHHSHHPIFIPSQVCPYPSRSILPPAVLNHHTPPSPQISLRWSFEARGRVSLRLERKLIIHCPTVVSSPTHDPLTPELWSSLVFQPSIVSSAIPPETPSEKDGIENRDRNLPWLPLRETRRGA